MTTTTERPIRPNRRSSQRHTQPINEQLRADAAHLYLALGPQSASILYVHADQTAIHYSLKMPSPTAHQALEYAMQRSRAGTAVILHTPDKTLQRIVRDPEQWPTTLRDQINRHQQRLLLGSIAPGESLWRDLLVALQAGHLKATTTQLFLSALTDGHRTYVGGILHKPSGVLNFFTKTLPGTDLTTAELHGVIWAFEGAYAQEMIEIHHNTKEGQAIWANPDEVDPAPGTPRGRVMTRIGELIGQKELGFQVPRQFGPSETVMRQGVRTIVAMEYTGLKVD